MSTEKSDCIFCRIVAGEVPTTLLYEGENVIAFDDISPQAPVHTLIIPRAHIASMNDVMLQQDEIVARMFHVARDIAKEKGIDQTGYQLLIRTGRDGGQEVDHVHLHLTGGKDLGVNIG
jgi:histidine triad (HIT) family protein